MPLFKAFTNCFWHNICKVNCLKWYQIVHHLSQSRMVFIGGQNFSLFIYQLSLLLNYWLLFLSGTTDATTSYWLDNCRLRSSNWLYVNYQCKTNSGFIIILNNRPSFMIVMCCGYPVKIVKWINIKSSWLRGKSRPMARRSNWKFLTTFPSKKGCYVQNLCWCKK